MAFNINVVTGIITIYRETADSHGAAVLAGYPLSDFSYYNFNLDYFEFVIGSKPYRCDFVDLKINGVIPYDFDEANDLLAASLNPCCQISGSGIDGTFTTNDGQTVTFVDGIITEITGGS